MPCPLHRLRRPAIIPLGIKEFDMSYPTILVHVDDTRHVHQCIDAAVCIARAEHAHLIGVASTGVHAPLYPAGIADPTLPRHDVNVTVSGRSADGPVGPALLRMAAELGSDVIVMGAYGHRRFREILLGGVRRSILASMTVPALMSH
jgi:nucleotide-binding universal stress UspA family protein